MTRPVTVPWDVAVTTGVTAAGHAESGTARVAVRSPEASPASRSASSEKVSTVVAISALVRNGVGAANRPSSSCTTAASRAVAPAPPADSGTSRAARPNSAASDFHNGTTIDRSPS